MKIKQLATTAVVAAAVAAVTAAVAFLYYEHDPASPVAPKCLFRLISGYDCPGCGSQRALHALLHGRLAEAWGFNPYVFFAAPAGAAFVVIEAGRARWPRLHRAVIAAVLAATVAWWIFRNV